MKFNYTVLRWKAFNLAHDADEDDHLMTVGDLL